MRGNIFPIHEALIDLVQHRELGKRAFAQFTCEACEHNCTIPPEGESKTVFRCCRCSEMNYLDTYEIIVQ